MSRYLLAVVASACLYGCKTNGGPLVFVVTHTLGVDIQAASTSSATPGITFGYKSVDVAIVPTQMDTAGGAALKGCYAVGQNADIPVGNCAVVDDSKTAQATQSGKGGLSPAYLNDGAQMRGREPQRGRLIPAVLATPPPAAPEIRPRENARHRRGENRR